MNKKANIVDGFENVMWLIVGAFILIVLSFAVTTIGSSIEDKEGFDTPKLSKFWETLADMPVIMDWAFLLITLVTIGGSLIVYHLVNMEPLMYIVSWILTIILTIVIIVIGNALPILLDSFPTIVNQMLFIPLFIINVHWIALIYFVLALITMHTPK